MTAPQATDPAAFLDRLEETRDAIGDSPAFRVVGFDQGADVDHWVYARFDDGGQALFAECYGADAARVIAASLTSLPALIAAVRAVLALADELDGLVDDETVDETARIAHAWTLRRLRSTVTAALGATGGEL